MANETEIQPALTAEEWRGMEYAPSGADMIASIDDADAVDLLQREQSVYLVGKERHVVAALCLYGQPFGFRPEVVSALRGLKRRIGDVSVEVDGVVIPSVLDYVADRIETLLPPNGH